MNIRAVWKLGSVKPFRFARSHRGGSGSRPAPFQRNRPIGVARVHTPRTAELHRAADSREVHDLQSRSAVTSAFGPWSSIDDQRRIRSFGITDDNFQDRKGGPRVGRIMLRLIAALALAGVWNVNLAADYWNYTYKNAEVTTDENSVRAMAIAHIIARFDVALGTVMPLTHADVPIHIYDIAPSQARAILGENGAAGYQYTGYEVNIVSARTSRDFWGPLFGYVGSLLVSGRALRCPYWFRLGVPLLFANTDFHGESIILGMLQTGYIGTVRNSNLIPLREFLRMQGDDPRLKKDPQYLNLFTAESWFLSFEILVNNMHRKEFSEYLDLIRDGKTEDEAFSASFKISYEDLEKDLRNELAAYTYQYSVNVPHEPPDPQGALEMTGAEFKARLGYLQMLWQHRAEALRLSTEALKEDPKSDLALTVIARCQFLDDHYAEALAAINRLDGLPRVGAEARSAAGDTLSSLAGAVASKKASIGVEPEALANRSKDEYEQSIKLKEDYLPPWGGLAYLYAARHDINGAQAFVGHAHAILDKHIDNGNLARAFATMSSENSMVADAVFFGDFWRNNAPTQWDRNRANVFMAGLKAH